MNKPGSSSDFSFVDSIVARHGGKPEATLRLLQEIQTEYHYLPQAVLDRLCAVTAITPAQVAGVASFYNRFRLTPAGKHRIRVCVGTACHLKGAEAVYNGFRQYLGIHDENDTDDAQLFTVEKVACLGCCMLAPAVQIDSRIYGFVTSHTIGPLIDDFLRAVREEGPSAVTSAVTSGLKAAGQGEISLCTCSSCEAAGAVKVYRELQRRIAREKLPVHLKVTGCTGISFRTPFVTVTDRLARVFHYGGISSHDVASLLARHFPQKGFPQLRRLATDWLEKIYSGGQETDLSRLQVELNNSPGFPYWSRQQQLVTLAAGELSPLDIREYRLHGGFAALAKALACTDRDELIGELEKSGLRGRGGAGFPTAAKWRLVAAAAADNKYVIANGDEGDPGAFMDKLLLESFPFRVVEGMLIAGYAVRAFAGLLYIRSEYPLAIRRIKEAIRLVNEDRWLGERLAAASFPFQLAVVEGAGAFVCGEETALIRAIEGQRGIPSYKPPYPAEAGLWGKPTLVNNVETFAAIPWIIAHKGAAFAAIGRGRSTGTKAFSLAGKVRQGGLIEVPLGLTLHEIIYGLGGGLQAERQLKAVQIGGPAGGCIPAALVHTPVDFDVLQSAAAVMGSGGIVVLADDDCMVEVARYFMAFTQVESCGKCTYCRIGTKRMLELLTRLTTGQGKPGDIDLLSALALQVKELSACGLGRAAPNPVLSTLKYFREEYAAHLAGTCPAKKCKALITYRITDNCIGCTRCRQYCPVGAISGIPFTQHQIDAGRCSRCDTCRSVCPEKAVAIASGKESD